MASKSNIRSMRFSDAIMELIEQQAGETFTAKFENLVTRCVFELPSKEKELAAIQEQIQQERKNLQRIRKKNNDLENMIFRMSATVQQFNRSSAEALKGIERLMNEEKTQKNDTTELG